MEKKEELKMLLKSSKYHKYKTVQRTWTSVHQEITSEVT